MHGKCIVDTVLESARNPSECSAPAWKKFLLQLRLTERQERRDLYLRPSQADKAANGGREP